MAKPRRMVRSKHQIELMGIILRAAGEGVFLSMKDVHEKISYEAAYGTVRSSLRLLLRKEVLVGQNVGTRTLMIPTEKGYDWFRPSRM